MLAVTRVPPIHQPAGLTMQGEKYDVEFTVWCDGLRVTLEEIYDENSTRLRVRDNRSDDDYVLSFSVRAPNAHSATCWCFASLTCHTATHVTATPG